jgi:hypothetical protein
MKKNFRERIVSFSDNLSNILADFAGFRSVPKTLSDIVCQVWMNIPPSSVTFPIVSRFPRIKVSAWEVRCPDLLVKFQPKLLPSTFKPLESCHLTAGFITKSFTQHIAGFFTFCPYSSSSLWFSGQSSWLPTQRSSVQLPALPNCLRSSGSGTGSTQRREDKWGATWKISSGSCLENWD